MHQQKQQSEGFSTRPRYIIKKIQFGLLSTDEIIGLSVVKVDQIRIYDNETGDPEQGGLMDQRMGVSNPRQTCLTCENDIIECPGHFGHIELSVPQFHTGFLQVILQILKCVCFKCGMLRCEKESPRFRTIMQIEGRRKRLSELVKYCQSIRVCDHLSTIEEKETSGCGSSQPKFRRVGDQIHVEHPRSEEDKQRDRKCLLKPSAVLKIFKFITDDDCKILGLCERYSRPENLIFEVLPVLPVPSRPTVQFDSFSKSEDDLTHQYMSILKVNKEIGRMKIGAIPDSYLQKYVEQLQFLIATLMNNQKAGRTSKHKNGRAVKGIKARISGKEGRFRSNLMGKRVDFSGRTVISPDPNVALGQIGIPRSMALNLTFPERVTAQNHSRLTKLVRNGPSQYPGAKFIIRKDGLKFDLRFLKDLQKGVDLEYGYIVERHLQDGDFVLCNRQPSLHKMSLMGHQVKVLPYSTFRLNLTATPPYNADFDGDEMNIHVPQSLETVSELKELISISKHLISPQSNRPCMGLVMDSLLGSRLFTKRDTFLEREQVMNLMMHHEGFNGDLPRPAILRPTTLWTGKQILSMMIPDVNLTLLNKSGSLVSDPTLNDSLLVLENGELMAGMFDKSIMGTSSGGLLHCIWLEYGATETVKFLTSSQRVFDHWLAGHGFSLSLSDTLPGAKTFNEFRTVISNANKQINQDFDDTLCGQQKNCQPGKSILENFETQINVTLNNSRTKIAEISMKSLKQGNSLKNMIESGSKGSEINASQIIGCVGQQNVEGRRIPFGFCRRTLPHFLKDDYSPESRGFVQNSFFKGLTPQEFFFHAMGGREGIIDTAVKTQETGYIQRRLIKALEDIRTQYDGTVRDSHDNLIQFLYGEDGMAAEYVEDQRLEILWMNDCELKRQFQFFDLTSDISEQIEGYAGLLSEKSSQELLENPEMILRFDQEFKQIQSGRVALRGLFKTRCQYFPVNINRLIKNATIKFKHEDQSSFLDPLLVLKGNVLLKKRMILVKGKDKISKEAQRNSRLLFNIHIDSVMASKKLVILDRLTKEGYEWLLDEVFSRFQLGIIHPGEMVGVLAAQSIGEPATQMTLNTFHFAGVSSMNVTLGVPRLNEIINLHKNTKTPTMTVYLQSPSNQSSEGARLIQSKIQFARLIDLSFRSDILYDPDINRTVIKEDREFVSTYYEFADEDIEDMSLISKWVLRILLVKKSMLAMQMKLADIKRKIKTAFDENSILIVINHDNADRPILRVRMIKAKRENREFDIEIMKNLEEMILYQINMKGVPGVKKVLMRNCPRVIVAKDGGLVKQNHNEGEWILETDGSNLEKVISLEDVDSTRTVTNAIPEIHSVLGVEAARLSLLHEIRNVLDAYGIYVNYRHLSLLCDVMTQQGSLMAITRNGINRISGSCLKRASFEETFEQMLKAGLYAQTDELKGVSENLIIGQTPLIGSNSFDVLIDARRIKKAVHFPEKQYINSYDLLGYDDKEDKLQNVQTPCSLATPLVIRSPDMSLQECSEDSLTMPNGSFTPYHQEGVNSPMYQTQTGLSPRYQTNPSQQKSILYSPINQGGSPILQQGLQYSPTSPHYSSPVLQQKRVYSPSSPGYTMKSPAYTPTLTNMGNSPMYSQQQKKMSYTPSSPAYNMANPMMIQQDKSYKFNSPTFDGISFIKGDKTVCSFEEEEEEK